MGYSPMIYSNGRYHMAASYQEWADAWKREYGTAAPPITAVDNRPSSWTSGYLIQNAMAVTPGAQIAISAGKAAASVLSSVANGITGADIRSPTIKAAMNRELPPPGTPLATVDPSLSDRLKQMFPTLAQTGLGALAGAAITYAATRKGSTGSKKGRKKAKASKYRRSKKIRHKPSKHKSHKSKPRPGTKAWMNYIRSKRKHGRRTHKPRR